MTEPTVSFRELLATNPGTVTDDTEILITAGELRARLDELGRLRAQADEDAALVGWYLYADTPHSMRTAVLSNHFGARAQAVLDARMAALPDGEPRDRAAQLAVLRGVTKGGAAVPAEVWYFTDDDGGSSSEVYLDVESAKDAAVELYASEYDPADPDAEFVWRKSTPRDPDRSPWWLLDHGGVFTGWSVDSVRVAAPTVKTGAR